MESIGDDLGGGILGVGSPWASDRGTTVDPLSFPGALRGGTEVGLRTLETRLGGFLWKN